MRPQKRAWQRGQQAVQPPVHPKKGRGLHTARAPRRRSVEHAVELESGEERFPLAQLEAYRRELRQGHISDAAFTLRNAHSRTGREGYEGQKAMQRGISWIRLGKASDTVSRRDMLNSIIRLGVNKGSGLARHQQMEEAGEPKVDVFIWGLSSFCLVCFRWPSRPADSSASSASP